MDTSGSLFTPGYCSLGIDSTDQTSRGQAGEVQPGQLASLFPDCTPLGKVTAANRREDLGEEQNSEGRETLLFLVLTVQWLLAVVKQQEWGDTGAKVRLVWTLEACMKAAPFWHCQSLRCFGWCSSRGKLIGSCIFCVEQTCVWERGR